MLKDERTILQDSSFEEVDERIEKAQAPQSGEGKSDSWKYVTIGGATGILIGAGALYAANSYAAPSEDSNGDASDAFVHSTSGQSFNDAFAAARKEVGPGGVFEWHGKLYNTYYAEEWKAMSPAERSTFVQKALEQHPLNPHEHNIAASPIVEPEPEPRDEPTSGVLGKGEDKPGGEPLLATKHPLGEEEPNETPDVRIINLPGGEAGMAKSVRLNEEDIQIVDTDGDGLPDYSIGPDGEVINLHNGEILSPNEADQVIDLYNTGYNHDGEGFDDALDIPLHELSNEKEVDTNDSQNLLDETSNDYLDPSLDGVDDSSMDIIV